MGRGVLWQDSSSNDGLKRWRKVLEIMSMSSCLGEAMDPELRDWKGLYRQQHVLRSSQVPFAVVFLAPCVHGYDSFARKEWGPIPAVTRQCETGVGWDRSFKQRLGWSVGGGRWYSQQSHETWHEDGTVSFKVLPEPFGSTKIGRLSGNRCAGNGRSQ